MSDMEYIGTLIKELRNAKGWSQIDLAKRTGISKPTIENIESGKNKNPQFKTLFLIFRALGCNSIPLSIEDTLYADRDQSINEMFSLLAPYSTDTIKLFRHVFLDTIHFVTKIREFPRG